MTKREQTKQLKRILAEHDALKCKACKKTVGWGEISWNNASTEAGTDCAMIDIICQGCQSNIAHIFSWYPGIDDLDEVLRVLERGWK